MKQQELEIQIRKLMTRFVLEVEGAVAMKRLDVNSIAEDVLVPLFRELYGYPSLRNINRTERANYPAVDLVADEEQVAFQVTATTDAKKVKGTLEKFVKYKLDEKYTRLIIYLLTKKPSRSSARSNSITKGRLLFNRARDIWDFTDVLRAVGNLGDIDRLERIANELDLSLGDERLHLTVSGSHELLERYCHWIREASSTFTIAGLKVSLPIEQAWVQLTATDQEEQYHTAQGSRSGRTYLHEWERLAHSKGVTTDAEHIVQFNKRVVVVAGPGSGKSTLLRRLAHKYSRQGEWVVWARLPLIANAMKKRGLSFHSALCDYIHTGIGVTQREASYILDNVSYLFVDGLDECDPDRRLVCSELTTWGISHPTCAIVATTRPVGHDPARFPAWKHYELQPLGAHAIHKYVEQILKGCFPDDEKRVADELERFQRHIEGNVTATFAAKNPLLLGFLIHLSLNHVTIGARRAEIYEQIISLAREHEPSEREGIGDIETFIASSFLEAFGWLLQESPALSQHQLISDAGQLLAKELGVKPLQAQRQAEQAIRYWESRQLLERTSSGIESIVSFLHPTLAEYCAGKYICSWEPEKQQEWLRDIRHSAKWRETILLAAGAGAVESIITLLVDLDDPTDPLSTEALLAASALVEATGFSQQTLERVCRGLLARLSSSIPLIAFETTESCLALARMAPSIIGPFASEMIGHAQPWTNLAAWTLALEAGEEYVDFQRLQRDVLQLLPDPEASSRWNGPESKIREQCVCRAVDVLLKNMLTPESIAIAEQVLFHPSITIGMAEDLSDILRAHGQADIVLRYFLKNIPQSLFGSTLNFSAAKERTRAVATGFLEIIIDACAEAQAEPFDSTLPALSALLGGLNYHSVPYVQFEKLSRCDDVEAVVTVLRGAIAAMELEPKELCAEAHYALQHTQASDSYGDHLSDMISTIRPALDWTRATGLDYDGPTLARALNHPSAIVANLAAELIARGCGPVDIAAHVERVFRTGGYHALHYGSRIAAHLWAERAESICLDRLEDDLEAGCQYLFINLKSVSNGHLSDRMIQCIQRGLLSDDADITAGAAQGLLSFDTAIPHELALAVERAWALWSERDASEPYLKREYRSPRSYLISLLWKAGSLDFDELLWFYENDHDVRQRAGTVLVEASYDKPELLIAILDRIYEARTSPELLEDLIGASIKSNSSQEIEPKIIRLLQSPHPTVRTAAVRSLGLCWTSSAVAQQLCQERLTDEDPNVRSQAIRTLRTLQE